MSPQNALPDWQKVLLGELCSIDWGNTNITKASYTLTGYAAYSAAGQDGRLPYYEYDGQAVVVSAIGARCGKCFFATGKWTAIKNTIVLKAKEPRRVDEQFLYYILNNENIWPRSGSGQPFIAIGKAGSIRILLPPLSEQRAIAQTLQVIQDSIEARRKELELERERKAALMDHLFSYGTRNEATKTTEIGEIPESWEVTSLGELISNRTGTVQTGPFGSQLHAYDYRDSGIPVVNPTHLGFNTIVEDNLPFIDKDKADSLSRHYLAIGDILVSRRGDFSRYSYIKEKFSGWLCGTGCILIRLRNLKMDNRFLSVHLGTAFVQSYFKHNSVGSIMPNLNTKILGKLPIPLPHIDEQREIADAFDGCNAKIDSLERETAVLEELFEAMLEELMTGRLSAVPLIESEESV